MSDGDDDERSQPTQPEPTQPNRFKPNPTRAATDQPVCWARAPAAHVTAPTVQSAGHTARSTAWWGGSFHDHGVAQSLTVETVDPRRRYFYNLANAIQEAMNLHTGEEAGDEMAEAEHTARVTPPP